jgi:hypothetical protein
MYWYGWLALSFTTAAVVGWIATMIPTPWLQRATVFCCVLATLWPTLLALGIYVADRASFDAEILKSLWIWALPALAGAAAVGYYVSSEWADRVWTRLLLIMPIGGLLVLGYSLKSFFTR